MSYFRASKVRFLLLFLFILSLFGLWRWPLLHPPSPPDPSNALEAVDAFMDYSVSQHFNASGLLEETLQCDHWIHLQSLQETTMDHPHLTYTHSDGLHWALSADTGTGFHDTLGRLPERILLKNQVILSEYANAQHTIPHWRLMSEDLSIYPEAKICDTEGSVFFKHPSLEVKAKGFSASLNNETIDFKNDVNSLYFPNNQ